MMAASGGATEIPTPRVIRYMGNKSAVLEPIRAAFERLADEGALVVDPMAGSQAFCWVADC